MILLVLMLGLFAYGSPYAGNAEQTNWESGPFTSGPVSEWNSEFDSHSGIDYHSQPGQLTLTLGSREVVVDNGFDGAFRVHVADVDSDGDMDVLGSSWGGNQIAWWENQDGSGNQWEKHVIGSLAGVYSLDATDIDGDGHPDILAVSVTMDRACWWENPDGGSGSWAYHFIAPCNSPNEARGADLDGDGDNDIAVAIMGNDEVAWWENVDGAGTSWMKHSLSTGLYNPGCICLSDIDMDGDIDVAGPGPIAWIAWWENPQIGGGEWIEHTIPSIVGSPSGIGGTDLNGDGFTDLLAVGLSGQLVWWRNMDGIGSSWTQVILETGLSYPEAFCADDLDGDGDTDIASQGKVDYELGWWENVSGASSWEYHSIEHYFNATDIHNGDLDGDGVSEIAGVYTYRDLIHWFDLFDGHIPSGELVSSILYLGEDPEGGDIDWTGDEPGGTSIAFLVRASDDSGDMGAWSDTLHSPCGLVGTLEDGDSYLQYIVLMDTEDSTLTPRLDDVMFSWVSVGVEESFSPIIGSGLDIHVWPNPASGQVSAWISLPIDGSANLMVYDITGRIVSTLNTGYLEAGEHQVMLGESPPGIYFCMLRCAGIDLWNRFVVCR